MKKIFQILAPVVIMLALLSPVLATAANQGLIPCGRAAGDGVDANTTHECGFKDIITLINKIITFILIDIAIPICAIMFAYAGFLLITSGASSGEAKTKAKTIFTSAVTGLLLIAGAWLIINTILSVLGFEGAWIGFKKIVI